MFVNNSYVEGLKHIRHHDFGTRHSALNAPTVQVFGVKQPLQPLHAAAMGSSRHRTAITPYVLLTSTLLDI